MENAVILQIIVRIYILWSKSTNRKKEELKVLRKEQQRTEYSNWEEIQEICQEQEKEDDGKRAPTFPGNAVFWWQEQGTSLQRDQE